MIFPASIFLYLLPLAGLPILFHLILKRKKRTVVFSTLMFFHRTNPRLNSHRKIRQWLLLLMRILLIALILLALSRPKFVTSAHFVGKISVVAIVDNSGSMSATAEGDNDNTALQCAVEGARRLISTLQGGCEAAVVLLVDDPAVEVADSLTSDKEGLLACLDKIRPTQATGNASLALTRSFELLRASSAGSGAVHVFSDLQQSEWANLTTDEREQTPRPSSPITVYFHKIKPQIRDEANVAITAIQFPQERILPNHPYTVGLVLQNNSDVGADIRVNSVDSYARKNTENVVLAAGRTKAVELEVKLDEAGYHWIKAWIEGDGFSADNEAAIALLCEETATVLFAGKPEEFGVLPVALSPSGQGQFTGMIVEYCSAEGGLNKTVAEKKAILIVTTWNGMQSARENSAWLQEYVENGGNLLIVPSAAPGQRTFSGQFPNWLGAGIRQREVYPQGAKLEILDNKAAFWQRIREATSDSQLEPISVYVFYPLQVTAEFTPLEIPETSVKPQEGRFLTGFTPLLGVDSPRRIVIAHRKLGQGNIYVSGTAFASRWNTLPSTAVLVVMAQRMAVTGTSSKEGRALSLVAGEQWHGHLGRVFTGRRPVPRINAQGGEVEILSLVGDPMDWKGKESEIPAFPLAGVYSVKAVRRTPYGGNDKYCISVRASEKEGLEEFVEGSQVPAMGQVAHKILPYDEEENFQQYHTGQARAIELYLFLLLLATLALLVEGWLGAPRPAQGRFRTLYFVKRISFFASRLRRAS
ncbi:MAG: BatA and WFA domain-containing protein [Phycisphaerae bacterium]